MKQQAEGRVPVTARIGGAPANDDPGLEREADELGAKAAHSALAPGAAATQTRTGSLAADAPATPTSPAPMQAKADSTPSDEPLGPEPRVEALDDEAAEGQSASPSMAPIQKAPNQPASGSKGKKDYIPFKITVAKPMTREEFEAAANLQVFGTAAVASQWHNVKENYTAADSPVEVLFETSLVRRLRGAANTAKGIDADATGKVAGADARANDFQAQPVSDV